MKEFSKDHFWTDFGYNYVCAHRVLRCQVGGIALEIGVGLSTNPHMALRQNGWASRSNHPNLMQMKPPHFLICGILNLAIKTSFATPQCKRKKRYIGAQN